MDRVVADIVFDFGTKPRLSNQRGNAILVASSIYEACKYFELFQKTVFKGKCAVVTSYNPQAQDITLEETGANTETDKQFIYNTYTALLQNVEALPGKSKTETYEDHAKKQFKEQPANMRLLVVVDLPGPESVAFAAGLQPLATAVFQFGNWPHPRGVVPAHETLAALLFHRPTFVKAPDDPKRPAVFVLDRNRLALYANEPERFDNRYVVRLPTATTLRTMQIERIVYVVPEGAPEQELDDCNETFVAYRAAGIGVRLVSAGDFQPADLATAATAERRDDATTQRYYYGGSPLHHWWFWQGFGGGRVPPGRRVEPPTMPLAGARYQPSPRPLASSHLLGLGRSTARVADDRAGGNSGQSTGGSWGRTHYGGSS